MNKNRVFERLLAAGTAFLFSLAAVTLWCTTDARADAGISISDTGVTYLVDDITATSKGYKVDANSSMLVMPGTVVDLSAISAADFKSNVVIDGSFDNEGLVIYNKDVDTALLTSRLSGKGVFGYKDGSGNMKYWRVDRTTGDILSVNFVNGDLVLGTSAETGAGYTWSLDGSGGMVFTADSLYVNGNIFFPYNKEVTLNTTHSVLVAGNIAFSAGPASERSSFRLTVTGEQFHVGGNLTGGTAMDTVRLKNTETRIRGAVSLGTGTEGGSFDIAGAQICMLGGFHSTYGVHTAAFSAETGFTLALNTIELMGASPYIQVGGDAIVKILLTLGTGSRPLTANKESAFSGILSELNAVYQVQEYTPGHWSMIDQSTGKPASPLFIMVPKPPAVVVGSERYTVDPGGSITMSVTADSLTGEVFTYQWQEKAGSKWKDINGATSMRYALVDVSAEMNQSKYHCIVTGTGGSTISGVMTLEVIGPLDSEVGDRVNMGSLYAMAGTALAVIVAALIYTLIKRKKR